MQGSYMRFLRHEHSPVACLNPTDTDTRKTITITPRPPMFDQLAIQVRISCGLLSFLFLVQLFNLGC